MSVDLNCTFSAVRSALVSDALDQLGLHQQALGSDLRPLNPAGVTVGHALPVRAAPSPSGIDEPYDGLLTTLDAIGPGQIVVIAAGRSDAAAVWGELCHTVCQAAGGVGVITDGLIRDTAVLRASEAVAYARGAVPRDIAGRLAFADLGGRVDIDGVAIAAADVVVADEDGVVIVPADVAEEVLSRANAKAADEGRFKRAVREGMGSREAFRRFSVL